MAKRGRPTPRKERKKNSANGGLAGKVKDYRHEEKRPNNPPAGLATYDKTAPSRKQYAYDPHLDPQLVWAGKAERQSATAKGGGHLAPGRDRGESQRLGH